jgi:WD40 repeat protein
VFGSGSPEVEVWHLAAPDQPWKLRAPDRVGTLAWHPSGRQVAVAAAGNILLWDLGADRPRHTLTGHYATVTGLAFAPGGGLLASTSYDGTVRLWDTLSGRQLLTTPGVHGPWFSHDGRGLAFANGTRLEILRVGETEVVWTHLRTRNAGIAAVDFSPDGRLLAGGGEDGVHVWDVTSGAAVAELPGGHTSGAWFSPDGTTLVTGGPQPPALWSLTPDRPHRGAAQRYGPPQLVNVPAPGRYGGVALSRDGRTLAVHVDRDVVVLDQPAQSVRLRLPGPVNLWRPAVSPDGRWIAAGCWHGLENWVWDGATGRVVHRFTYPMTAGCRVEFSPDGRWLVTGTGGEYQVLETGTWRTLATIPRDHAGALPGIMAFTPDARILAVAHSPDVVKLVRPDTAQEVATLTHPDPHLLGWLTFSPDGTRLAAGTEGDRLFLWDLRSIRGRLAALGLDWDLPAPPPPAGLRDPEPIRVTVDPGELHPARRRTAHYRRVLQSTPDDPRACNGLAWYLATGPDDMRDPAAALPLAEKAVRLDSRYECLNTLGVVYYRLGRLTDAVDALTRSVAANKGEVTAYDAFFLALCHHRLGAADKARGDYARGVWWMDLYRPDDNELLRFRAEADDLLGR